MVSELGALTRAIRQLWTNLCGEDRVLDLAGVGLRSLLPREKCNRREEAKLAIHAGDPNPLKSSYFWNRSTRLLPIKVFSEVTVIKPFLDRQLMHFLLTLLHEIAGDKCFRTQATEMADSSIGEIPFERKDTTRASRTRGYQARLFLSLAADALAKGQMSSTRRDPRQVRRQDALVEPRRANLPPPTWQEIRASAGGST